MGAITASGSDCSDDGEEVVVVVAQVEREEEGKRPVESSGGKGRRHSVRL